MRSFMFRSFCIPILSLFLIFGLILGCGGDDSEPAEETGEETSMKAPLADDEVLLQKASEQVIARFASEMKAALTFAIQEGGPAEALSVCNVVAPDIAIAHARDGWFVSRITTQPRNVNNEADAEQESILNRFASDSTLNFIARWDNPEEKTAFHYYKPIRTQEICLNCHGGNSMLSEDVKAKLAELYPEDEATGYQLGDLRGMFEVEVVWPEGRDYAARLVQPEG